MGGKASNGRERVYIIALAPACLMVDKNRRSLEEILTKRKGGGAGEKRAIKDIRDDMKRFGVELGDDHPNVMVAWVGPGQAGDTRDDNVMRRSVSDEGESVFRRMMSTMGVIPLSWSSTRALMPMVSDWHNSGTISVANDKSRGQHCYLAMVAILASLLPLDIDLPREREGHPNWSASLVKKGNAMPSEGRVVVLPRIAWRRRVGELLTEWFTAVWKGNESAMAARDSSRRDLQRASLERPEIFYEDSVSFGENLHRAGKGLFQEAVKESTGILSAMMRRGCTITASSSKEDVADFVRFIESYVGMEEPEWSKLEKHKRFALEGGESDDAAEKDDPMQGGESAITAEAKDMQAPPSPAREVTKAPSGATKRISPNPERMGEQAKKPASQKPKADPPIRGGSDADVEESEATASEGSSVWPTLAEGARRAKSKAKAKTAPAALSTQNAFHALEESEQEGSEVKSDDDAEMEDAPAGESKADSTPEENESAGAGED